MTPKTGYYDYTVKGFTGGDTKFVYDPVSGTYNATVGGALYTYDPAGAVISNSAGATVPVGKDITATGGATSPASTSTSQGSTEAGSAFGGMKASTGYSYTSREALKATTVPQTSGELALKTAAPLLQQTENVSTAQNRQALYSMGLGTSTTAVGAEQNVASKIAAMKTNILSDAFQQQLTTLGISAADLATVGGSALQALGFVSSYSDLAYGQKASDATNAMLGYQANASMFGQTLKTGADVYGYYRGASKGPQTDVQSTGGGTQTPDLAQYTTQSLYSGMPGGYPSYGGTGP